MVSEQVKKTSSLLLVLMPLLLLYPCLNFFHYYQYPLLSVSCLWVVLCALGSGLWLGALGSGKRANNLATTIWLIVSFVLGVKGYTFFMMMALLTGVGLLVGRVNTLWIIGVLTLAAFGTYFTQPVLADKVLLMFGCAWCALLTWSFYSHCARAIMARLLLMFILLLVLSIQFNLHSWPLAFIGLCTLGLSLLMREKLMEILLWVALAMVLTSLAEMLIVSKPMPQRLTVKKTLPTVVHVILDEHIGLSSIPKGTPGLPELKRRIVNLYQSNGFRVYTNVYSHYAKTINSLINQFNFTHSAKDHYQNNFHHGFTREGKQVGNLNYFAELAKRGYVFAMTGPRYLSLCGQIPREQRQICTDYPNNNIQWLAKSQLTLKTKVRYLIVSLISQSTLIRSNLKRLAKKIPQPWFSDYIAPHVHLAPFDWLDQKVKAAGKGEVIFAHILAPHYPYLYQADCQPITQMTKSHTTIAGRGSSYKRKQRYTKYVAQLTCVTAKVAKTLALIKANPNLRDALVIIQGDHGARLSLHRALTGKSDLLTLSDIRDDFHTFYAVKSPNLQRLPADGAFYALEFIFGKTLQTSLKLPIHLKKVKPFVFLRHTKPRGELVPYPLVPEQLTTSYVD